MSRGEHLYSFLHGIESHLCMVGTTTSLSEFTPTFVDCENFKVEALANQLVNITAYQKFPKNTMEVDNAVENAALPLHRSLSNAVHFYHTEGL